MNATSPRLIQWQEAWNIGFARFDREHVELMHLANAITLAIYEKQSLEVLSQRVDALIDRTSRHFDDEEAMMGQYYYPDLQQHRASHDRLMRDLARHAAKVRAGNVSEAESGSFLMDWYLEHILQSDVQYARYFNERGLN